MFPWRADGVDPYVVLVSEIMLQQTQAPRVAELLPPFLELFPAVDVLAEASKADVIRAWKGLGYNNRAVRLRDAAQRIVSDHGGRVPSDPETLITLPGIGPYAAASIATFAFDARTVVLDVNVRRVYSRLAKRQPLTTSLLDDSALRDIAEHLIPKRSSASEWHHAVMDLGATVCMARRTLCAECPLHSVCASAHTVAPPNRGTSEPSHRGTIEPSNRRTKQEPMFRGEPRRLWRGRMVAVLRDHPKGLTPAAIVRDVFGSVDTEEQAFVQGLLQLLLKDGMMEKTGRWYHLPQ